MRNIIAWLFSAVLLSGCATNNFSKFYTDRTAGVPPAVLSQRLRPYSGSTQIVRSDDLQIQYQQFLRRGFVALGESSFEGSGKNTEEQLTEQGKAVGADVVLYTNRYQGSEQRNIPLLQYNPGQTSTTSTQSTTNANVRTNYGTSAYGTANTTGNSTTTTPGTYSTHVVPITVHRYGHSAIYMRKAKAAILGTNVANLPDDIRRTLKRNTGVLVQVVVDDTPAFRANVVPGDILIRIDDTSIDSSEDFMQKLPLFASKDCVLTVLREGNEVKIPVKLNAKPL
jgi:serine protease Do